MERHSVRFDPQHSGASVAYWSFTEARSRSSQEARARRRFAVRSETPRPQADRRRRRQGINLVLPRRRGTLRNGCGAGDLRRRTDHVFSDLASAEASAGWSCRCRFPEAVSGQRWVAEPSANSPSIPRCVPPIADVDCRPVQRECFPSRRREAARDSMTLTRSSSRSRESPRTAVS